MAGPPIFTSIPEETEFAGPTTRASCSGCVGPASVNDSGKRPNKFFIRLYFDLLHQPMLSSVGSNRDRGEKSSRAIKMSVESDDPVTDAVNRTFLCFLPAQKLDFHAD